MEYAIISFSVGINIILMAISSVLNLKYNANLHDFIKEI